MGAVIFSTLLLWVVVAALLALFIGWRVKRENGRDGDVKSQNVNDFKATFLSSLAWPRFLWWLVLFVAGKGPFMGGVALDKDDFEDRKTDRADRKN
ncbi:MAG TPA: hypothetical protein VJJ02_02135 [Candidatus Paceibacterota bacterium]